jgi:hypothetical protein
MTPKVLRSGRPECCGSRVTLEHTRQSCRVNTEITFDHIELLITIFHEIRVSFNISSDVILYTSIVRAVNGDGTLEGIVNRIRPNVRLMNLISQMEMDTIATLQQRARETTASTRRL